MEGHLENLAQIDYNLLDLSFFADQTIVDRTVQLRCVNHLGLSWTKPLGCRIEPVQYEVRPLMLHKIKSNISIVVNDQGQRFRHRSMGHTSMYNGTAADSYPPLIYQKAIQKSLKLHIIVEQPNLFSRLESRHTDIRTSIAPECVSQATVPT